MSEHSRITLEAWTNALGLCPAGEPWVIEFTLSSVPVEHWFYRRNALKAEDLRLTLNVPSSGLWKARLERHDRLFQLDWWPDNELVVESEQLRYSHTVKWPGLAELFEFPALVGDLEQLLGVSFVRHVDVGSRNLQVKSLLAPGSSLHVWLSPCADTLGQAMKSGFPDHA